ncbi:hypothetical protein EXS70_00435 [Candidatus Peribacteria bacterium]|nr:hypothetical protein [Candidatus Peribacteria bacterium]
MSITSNIHRENIEDETPDPNASAHVELSTSPTSKIVDSTLESVQRNISQDAPMNQAHIQSLESAIAGASVTVEGRTFTLEDGELKQNGKIWREILDGKSANHSKLTILPPAIAIALAKDQDYFLKFPLITKLSDETIAGLLQGDNHKYIELNGFQSISTKQFFALRSGKRGLQMDGLSSLPPLSEQNIQALSSGRRDSLRLTGLNSISSQELQMLLSITGDLGLDGLHSLPELSDDVLRALENHEAHLSLDGISSLSDKQFRQLLSKRRNTIRLDGIKKLPALSKETENALSNREWGCLSMGLETISDSEFRSLLHSPKDTLSLSKITTLPEFSEETVRWIANHNGDIALYGLTSLSDKQFRSLLKNKQSLMLEKLPALPELSQETIQALRDHHYSIGLRGLTSISDRAAHAFKQHVFGTYLSPAIEKEVQKHPYI